jgi:hypothetical protein
MRGLAWRRMLHHRIIEYICGMPWRIERPIVFLFFLA